MCASNSCHVPANAGIGTGAKLLAVHGAVALIAQQATPNAQALSLLHHHIGDMSLAQYPNDEVGTVVAIEVHRQTCTVAGVFEHRGASCTV